MRLLIADKFPEGYVQDFQSLGLEVTYTPDLDGEALVTATAGAQILVVRSTKVTRAVIEKAKGLELVIRAGAGFDNIDVAAASERGIFVANCPGKNSVAVAELTMGLLLALDRRIAAQASDLVRGKWNKKEYGKAEGLKGKTMGLAGSGPFAVAVARRAAAFDLKVVMWSRSLTAERAAELEVDFAPTLYDLADRSHIVSVHLAQTPETKRLFNADFFAHMGDGTIFINTSRGGLHDEAALVAVMKERGVRAALDVYEGEPSGGTADFTSELFSLPGFVGTHHIGASTEQAQNAIAHESVRICREYVTRGHAPNAVNIERHSPAKVQLIVRHLDKVGVLAEVLGIIRNHGLNIEEMTNTIFEGSKAAVAVIRLSGIPDESIVQEIAALEDKILHVEAKAAR